MKYWFYSSFILLASFSMAQNTPLPYEKIPNYPESYASGNVLSRMVDGLGFRYYWASDGLTQTDLDFKPSPDARSTFETLQHLYVLSDMILNAAKNEPNIRPLKRLEMTYEELRQKTLEQFQEASALYQSLSEEELSKTKVIYSNRGNQTEFELWHVMNGPIADAIYHTGQVVSFRRTSGNPMNPRVNVFTGALNN